MIPLRQIVGGLLEVGFSRSASKAGTIALRHQSTTPPPTLQLQQLQTTTIRNHLQKLLKPNNPPSPKPPKGKTR